LTQLRPSGKLSVHRPEFLWEDPLLPASSLAVPELCGKVGMVKPGAQMAAKATLALSGPEVRSSASAEPLLLGRVEEQRGPGLDRLPDRAELSPGEAVGLRSHGSPRQGLCQVHTDLGFSQSLTGAATSWPSLLLRGAGCPFPPSAFRELHLASPKLCRPLT